MDAQNLYSVSSGRPLRGAIVGYGFISSRGHLPAYQQRARTHGDVEIVAIADICEARRARAQEAMPEARIYSSFRALLEAETGHLDFIDVSTPPYAHSAIAHAALSSGLHVLCEKPLTSTPTEALRLLSRARASKRVLFPCHNYKHAPVVRAISEVIDSGRIGKVRSLTLNTFRNTHAKGVSEWKTDWRREKKYGGGGIAMDHGSHSFYLMFDWLRAFPTKITAKMSTLTPNLGHDTEDNFTATLTFPTGLAHAHLTWTAGVRKVIYTVQGERGAITVQDDEMEIATLNEGGAPGAVEKRAISSHWMDASHVHWFGSLFEKFKRAIQTEDFVGSEAIESYVCVETIHQAYRSALNHSVEMPLDWKMQGDSTAKGDYFDGKIGGSDTGNGRGRDYVLRWG